MLGQQLIDARARADFAAGGQRCAGQQVAGLRAVDVPLVGLVVVQAADEEHLLAEVGQRREHLAQAPCSCRRPWPTTPAVETVAGEEHGQPHRRLAGLAGPPGFIAPDAERLEPGQSHADAEATQHRTAGESVSGHGAFLFQEGAL